MAWFHNSLLDMKKAIEEKRWKDAKKILKMHRFPEENIKNEIKTSSYHAHKYFTHLQVVFVDLCQFEPSQYDRLSEDMIRNLNYAIGDIEKFETIVKKLIKEGKFEE